MATADVQIRDLSEAEIVQLVQVTHALFSASGLSDHQVTAYTNLLRHKFSYLTFGRVMHLCEEAATAPSKADMRFTPSFMATVLRGYEKMNQNLTYVERELSMSEKVKYREAFLKDLYSDFNNVVLGNKPTRIKVWQYVAELLVRSGFAQSMPSVREPVERGGLKRIDETMNYHESFVLDCFRKMITQDSHVRDYIHGIETA